MRPREKAKYWNCRFWLVEPAFFVFNSTAFFATRLNCQRQAAVKRPSFRIQFDSRKSKCRRFSAADCLRGGHPAICASSLKRTPRSRRKRYYKRISEVNRSYLNSSSRAKRSFSLTKEFFLGITSPLRSSQRRQFDLEPGTIDRRNVELIYPVSIAPPAAGNA